MKPESNLGTGDRVVRLSFAAIFLLLYFLGVIGGAVAAILLSLSAVLALTAVFSFCPLYRITRFNTRKEPLN